jgi:DNA adenine methylase
MPKYTCEHCLKEFSQKSHYTKHKNKKLPCQDNKRKIEEVVENIMSKKLISNNTENTITITTEPRQDMEIKRNNLKPIIKWSGGKTDELKQILPHIPDSYSTYLEPFIGGGAVYFHLNPEHAVINDVHKELVDFYQSIKNGNATAIYNFMKQHPNEEEVYYKVRGYDSTDILDNAKRFYYLRKTCYRGMLRYNKNGGFNIPFGRYKTYNFEEIKNKEYEELLKRTEIFNSSFENIFNKYNDGDNFMFLDPPYDSEFTDYGYCTFGKEEQKKLAKCFKETNIKCLMIIGKTPFIQELYKDYIVDEYDKRYRFKLHSGRVGDEINTKHLIIKNYS